MYSILSLFRNSSFKCKLFREKHHVEGTAAPLEGLNQKRSDGTKVPSMDAFESFPNDVNPESGEVGGPRGLEPTRYGDWERKGRCIDF
ncbi:Succinate dehydrogenase assembly factor 4, mitochondrial [Schistosoma japonicum]|nr:Succinate dehydrogenase assembly factor 4, mitochondrial [Schistosoma japonicum]KAH8871763.1 Succinate dehydrogenase assembly factor 4, mitochondrial [Schistosoma japonicum]KAH8871765.1 Succinate dehydrogenase assembly factor 4, mitochondrial [Schistosoma japonicum]KAH8871766.1 Succinate dehydrogenase assembly factor 4, mitochondrial [Schistosoma japonicum]